MFALLCTRIRRHKIQKVEANHNLPSSGVGYFATAVKVRTGPGTGFASVATYAAGDTVAYDSIVNGDGRVWISYIGNSGNRRYCCAIDSDGSQYINPSSGGGGGGDVFGGVTGLKNIPPQGQFAQPGIRGWGCCFLAACVKGGCVNQQQCVNCWNWAVPNGYVREYDSYVLAGCENLARYCSQHFGLTYHSDYSIVWNCRQSHFYVFRGGRELFNSAGLGWGVC